MECVLLFPSKTIQIMFLDGKILLERSYIEEEVTPLTFCRLEAVIVIGSEEIAIPIDPMISIKREPYYLLEESLSITYRIVAEEQLLEDSYNNLRESPRTDQRHTPIVVDVDTPPLSAKNVSPLSTATPTGSVVTFLLGLAKPNVLTKLLRQSSKIVQVKEIPHKYNGQVAFEFPPTKGSCKGMDSMEHRYDPYFWIKPQTTNITFPGVCRKSNCAGKLKCVNEMCPKLQHYGQPNRTNFRGSLKKTPEPGQVCNGKEGRLLCHYCKCPPICLESCPTFVYYVMPNDEHMSRLMIHMGVHEHDSQSGASKGLQDRVKQMVARVVKVNRHAGPRLVQMSIAKEIVMASLVKTGGEQDHIGEQELHNIIEEMEPLVQDPWFRRSVAALREGPSKESFGLDALLKLKKECTYRFFHGSRFPGQGSISEKCFVFKMSTIGPASGVDLVNRMQRHGASDLRRAWVQFDHTRRCLDWVTMACHVYDPSMQDLLTIATCEMKEEDMDAQILFWESINNVMEESGCSKADFFGFMADEAQANWNAVRTVFNGAKDKVMEGRERSCSWHWKHSLNLHSKYVNVNSQFEHKELCEKWRLSSTKEGAQAQSRLIRQWWRNGHVQDANLPAMDTWMSWWEIRIAHWGNVMTRVEGSNEGASTPSTNLSESKHGSWLAGEGFKRKISLYDACTTDMANAILQSAKAYSYSEGRHIGGGPSLEKLVQRQNRSPAQVVHTVNEATSGTPMYSIPNKLNGNVESARKKRQMKEVIEIDDDASHRPEYNVHVRDRREMGRPRKIHFSGSNVETEHGSCGAGHDNMRGRIVERNVNESMWAIRRTPTGSRLTCSGTDNSTRRCGRVIEGSAKGIPAASFEAYRKHPNGMQRQMMWFCPGHVLHCYIVEPNIEPKPMAPPHIWPVLVDTNISEIERVGLWEGGYVMESTINTENIEGTPRRCTTTTETGSQGEKDTLKGKGSVTRNGIRKRYRTTISEDAAKRIRGALELKAIVIEEEVIAKDIHEVFKIRSYGASGRMQEYKVYVTMEPRCTCADFKEREDKKKPYLACKHMYFVFLRVLGLSQIENMFIHQPVLEKREVGIALGRERTYPNLE